MESNSTINRNIEREPSQFLSLEEILEDEKIKEILEKIKKEKFTDEMLNELEEALKDKNFTFGPQDWIKMMEIIKQSYDFQNAGNTEFVKNTNKMSNIYVKFPETLLALYFKNKTEVDYRVLNNILFFQKGEDEGKKSQILEHLILIEKLKKFNEEIKTFYESLKTFKEPIIKEFYEIHEKAKELKRETLTEVIGEEKMDLLKLKSETRERIDVTFTTPSLVIEVLKDLFEKELNEKK